jgi:hypothetical protein
VLDIFKGYITTQVRYVIHAVNIDLADIPGGMTLHLQVVDTEVNNPSEDYLNQLYSEWLLQGIMFFSYTIRKIKNHSVELLWLKTPWKWISPKVTVKRFKKC